MPNTAGERTHYSVGYPGCPRPRQMGIRSGPLIPSTGSEGQVRRRTRSNQWLKSTSASETAKWLISARSGNLFGVEHPARIKPAGVQIDVRVTRHRSYKDLNRMSSGCETFT